MLAPILLRTSSAPLRILCLGAHSDDIEIGCGGLILRLLAGRRRVSVDWVVFSAEGRREAEARRGAQLFLKGAHQQHVVIRQFRDGFFPYEPAVKEAFEELKGRPAPDLVLTHYRHDRHQDHRVLSDLAWNTFRDHLVLEYEVPKYDGDLGVPNLFVPLNRRTCERKISFLRKAFSTQGTKYWFDDETFMGLMRLRGMECRAKYAEAFHARKVTVEIG